MKITKRQLKKIIKEEVARVLSEGADLGLRRAAQTVLSDLGNYVDISPMGLGGAEQGAALEDVIAAIAHVADPEYTDLAREQRGEIISAIEAMADIESDRNEQYVAVR